MPNKYTQHIRLDALIRNISMAVPESQSNNDAHFNPTIISLPSWSPNQYLLVSRVVTNGLHQHNVLCEANICSKNCSTTSECEIPCSHEDVALLGPAGGMRCATKPKVLNVPPTPAHRCEGKFVNYVDIPGFHDPRIFWSGRGEPLMIVNSQSRYACFGLWIIDLRTLHSPLQSLLASSPVYPSLGALMSYPTLTELTRQPLSARSTIEKNWMYFSHNTQSYIHYEIAPNTRSYAKLIGAGFTTQNLTDPDELPCLVGLGRSTDAANSSGTWHQSSNSLRLILCHREATDCSSNSSDTVFFAVIHRKHDNGLGLPLRYERYFMVWSGAPPFTMIGVSQYPILFANETASGWTEEQNWDDDPNNPNAFDLNENGTKSWKYGPYFTYTVSIAYAWGRPLDEATDKNVGYLDDEVVVGLGIFDQWQGYVRVRAEGLVSCLRACPGRSPL